MNQTLNTGTAANTVSTADLAAKIKHILTVYPQISPSMLQISLNIAAHVWRPVLEELILRGCIVRRHEVAPTPTGRHQTYTILSLSSSASAPASASAPDSVSAIELSERVESAKLAADVDIAVAHAAE